MKNIKAYGVCLYKKTKKSTKILLCKSVKSNDKWGFLKGVALKNENKKDTAVREFIEESSINIEKLYLEEFVYQKNELKDIGIYLVNINKIKNIDKFFHNDILYDAYLSWENSKVKFFDINDLPIIKKKQDKLIKEIINILK